MLFSYHVFEKYILLFEKRKMRESIVHRLCFWSMFFRSHASRLELYLYILSRGMMT